MDKALPLVAILAAGLLTAAEGATNGWVIKTSGSAYFAMLAALASSLVLLALFAPFVPAVGPKGADWRSLPWYAWLGGLYVLVTVFCAAWATPKLGAGPALVAALVAETALSLALDHFGVLGLERTPVTWLKVAGVGVMLAGALMVAVKR